MSVLSLAIENIEGLQQDYYANFGSTYPRAIGTNLASLARSRFSAWPREGTVCVLFLAGFGGHRSMDGRKDYEENQRTWPGELMHIDISFFVSSIFLHK
jgi:hypothetical protein